MANSLLRFVGPGMLLLWDRNFLSYGRVKQVVDQGAHLLAHVKKDLIFQPIRRFKDGSYLAKLYPNATQRKHDRNGIVVRIMDYILDDPSRVGHRATVNDPGQVLGHCVTRDHRALRASPP